MVSLFLAVFVTQTIYCCDFIINYLFQVLVIDFGRNLGLDFRKISQLKNKIVLE